LNGLHFFYPTLPGVPLTGTAGVVNLGASFAGRPWDAIAWSPLCIIPFAVGIGFLLPGDLLFSCWFFVFFWKAHRVMAILWGFSVGEYGGFPYVHQQMLGGYIAICAFSLWVSRRHLRAAWRGAWGREGNADSQEPLSYRHAFVGLAAGIVALTGFG